MAKIVWDAPGEHFYESGVDHVVLFTGKTDGTYNKGVAWNGVTAITESPDGAEPNDLYADNIKYASLRSAETFGGTIEAYQSPVEFDACDGTASPVAGLKIGQQKRIPFALVYRTNVGNDTASEEDDGYKLHIIFNATASPSEKAYETENDSPDAITYSWEFDTIPVNVTGLRPTSLIVIDSLKVDADKLKVFEDKIYGTDTAESTLPSPDEIIAMFSTAGD